MKQISSRHGAEKAVLYTSFYYDVSNNDLKGIFSILHSQFNDLFSFMNDKNNPGYGGHFNADPSRDLMDIIEQTRVILATLNQENSFEIDSYYKEVIDKCKGFLAKSNGSTIPPDFTNIDIIEHKPIFTHSDATLIQGPSAKSTVKIKLIGEGSYAKVFKCKDPHYGCFFAIKRAKDDLGIDELDRFTNEFKDLSILDSPFIIKVYQYDGENNEYTMEYADSTLEKYITSRNNSLLFTERKTLIIQLLNAFEYIHAKGILHRDISYQNVLIKYFDDGTSMIKVSDFGLVKRPNSVLTRKGTDVKGAINDYSDLEVVGFENYEIRHETYALAKVIYFILTGRQSGYNREVNSELKTFLLRAISSNKEKRFSSIDEMRDVLIKKVFPTLRTPSLV